MTTIKYDDGGDNPSTSGAVTNGEYKLQASPTCLFYIQSGRHRLIDTSSTNRHDTAATRLGTAMR